MPGIAIKYWLFQQTGWNGEEPTPEPIAQPRSDYDDWKWIGTHSPAIKPLVSWIEPRILTVIQFYSYTFAEYEISVRAKERLPFASLEYNTLFSEQHSAIFRKVRDYFTSKINLPFERSHGSVFTHENFQIYEPTGKEKIAFRDWVLEQLGEGNEGFNIPLLLSTQLRERHEHRTKSIVALPWEHSSIFEYASPKKTIGVDEDILLAALANIILLEEQ